MNGKKRKFGEGMSISGNDDTMYSNKKRDTEKFLTLGDIQLGGPSVKGLLGKDKESYTSSVSSSTDTSSVSEEQMSKREVMIRIAAGLLIIVLGLSVLMVPPVGGPLIAVIFFAKAVVPVVAGYIGTKVATNAWKNFVHHNPDAVIVTVADWVMGKRREIAKFLGLSKKDQEVVEELVLGRFGGSPGRDLNTKRKDGNNPVRPSKTKNSIRPNSPLSKGDEETIESITNSLHHFVDKPNDNLHNIQTNDLNTGKRKEDPKRQKRATSEVRRRLIKVAIEKKQKGTTSEVRRRLKKVAIKTGSGSLQKMLKPNKNRGV